MNVYGRLCERLGYPQTGLGQSKSSLSMLLGPWVGAESHPCFCFCQCGRFMSPPLSVSIAISRESGLTTAVECHRLWHFSVYPIPAKDSGLSLDRVTSLDQLLLIGGWVTHAGSLLWENGESVAVPWAPLSGACDTSSLWTSVASDDYPFCSELVPACTAFWRITTISTPTWLHQVLALKQLTAVTILSASLSSSLALLQTELFWK